MLSIWRENNIKCIALIYYMGKPLTVNIQNNTSGEWANVNNTYLEYLIQVSYPVFLWLEPVTQGIDNINGAF